MTKISHLSMIAGLKARDEDSVAAFLQEYWARAYRVAYHLTGDPGTAEDVAQETFVAVLKNISSLKESDSFRAWFFKILDNTAKKHHRTAARRAKHEEASEQYPREFGDPGQEAVEHERNALIRSQLGFLSPKLRQSLVLRYFEGLSLEEVALALDIPRKTVSSRIRLGLESLRERLEPRLNLSVATLPGVLAEALSLDGPVPEAPATMELLSALKGQPPEAVPESMDSKELLGMAAGSGSKGVKLFSAILLSSLVAALIFSALEPLAEDDVFLDPGATTKRQGGARLGKTEQGSPGSKSVLGSSTAKQDESELREKDVAAVTSAKKSETVTLGAVRRAPMTIQVFDKAGSPVAGLRLTWRSLSEAGDEVSSESDEEGQLRMPGTLRAGRYEVSWLKEGFQALSVHTREQGVEESETEESLDSLEFPGFSSFGKVVLKETKKTTIELKLTEEIIEKGLQFKLLYPKLSLIGVVLDPEGNPVPNADVGWRRLRGQFGIFRGSRFSYAKTNSDGEFRLNNLKLGRVEFVAKHSDWSFAHSLKRLTSQEPKTKLTLTMGHRCELRGKLLASGGRFSAGRVEAVPSGKKKPVPGSRQSDEDEFAGRRASAEVGPDGYFVLKGLPPGEVDLIGIVPGYRVGVKRKVKVFKNKVNSVELWVEKGLSIAGRLIGEDGQDIAVNGNIYYRKVDWAGSRLNSLRLFKEKNFLIEGLEPGQYKIDMRLAGYGNQNLTVKAGRRDLQIKLRRNANLRLKLQSSLGAIEEVSFMVLVGRSGMGRTVGLGNTGILALDGIDPKTSVVVLTVAGHKKVQLKIDPPLEPGETRTVTVHFESDGTMKGRKSGPRWDDPEELVRALNESEGKDAIDLITSVRNRSSQGGHPPTEVSSRVDLLPVLEAALAHKNDEVRIQGVCALAYMNNKATVHLLKKALKDKHSSVSYFALMGLGWLLDEAELKDELTGLFEGVMTNKKEALGNRLMAASALVDEGLLKDASVLLIPLKTGRGNAALAASMLAKMGRKDVIELLIIRLKTAQPSTDYHIGRALSTLTGKSFGTDDLKWRQWLEDNRGTLPEQLKK